MHGNMRKELQKRTLSMDNGDPWHIVQIRDAPGLPGAWNRRPPPPPRAAPVEVAPTPAPPTAPRRHAGGRPRIPTLTQIRAQIATEGQRTAPIRGRSNGG